MNRLLNQFQLLPVFQQLSGLLEEKPLVPVTGLAGSAPALLTAVLVSRIPALKRFRAVLYAAADEQEQSEIAEDLRVLLPALPVLVLTGDAQSQVQLLNLISAGTPFVTVTTPRALQSPAIAPAPEKPFQQRLQTGAAIQREHLITWLLDTGYEEVELVTEPGEFARRGGVIDAFPANRDLPVRVELLGDRILSLREFDPLTQRSVKQLESLLLPAWTVPHFRDAPVSSLLPAALLVVETVPTGIDCAARIQLVAAADASIRAEKLCDFGLRAVTAYLGNFALLRSEIAAAPDTWFVACRDEHQQERLRRLIGDQPVFLVGHLSRGFAAPAGGFLLLTERELYGMPVMRERRRRFRGLPIDDLLALHKGDYVVHINYGVGRFQGITRLTVEGKEHDFLEIHYANSAKVYVPVENSGLLDRYIGSDDQSPTLDRIGSRSWQQAKARTAKAVADYAEELLRISARRETARKIPCPADTSWQQELEAGFVHQETADQLRAIEEMKRDLESAKPMDRLVCGDVGYGKTEVALRGAFKVAMEARQVAVLAPTTILAYQHYETFRKRLAPYPLRVAMLSRFVSRAEQTKILEDLKAGRIDIIIGTHMLLSARVAFKNLGLLVIDEEQRFGVRQKEQIKKLKATVDILTLSATPIPRTLYMALAGLRDISTIHTPPAGRREIITEVHPWDEALIRNYCLREVTRGGQVFFIHNRIESLGTIHNRLCRLCPELRIAVAHGRMPERKLARVYLGFAAGEFDMLVSTAIVESGLDLPRVNTIIINRADRFGLADLHQLRGRVGRTQEQAYALLLIPEQHEIQDEARKRLTAILAYSQLGSGFKLALRDMEIRGVGNLLGVEQHGHISRVGFHLYTQLLREAVARLKGEEVLPEPELTLDVEAVIPESYISDSYTRVAIYKRLLSVDSEKELEALRAEMLDRFGSYPGQVENLFQVALVRIYARQAGLRRVALKGSRITLTSATCETVMKGDFARLLEILRQSTSSRSARGGIPA